MADLKNIADPLNRFDPQPAGPWESLSLAQQIVMISGVIVAFLVALGGEMYSLSFGGTSFPVVHAYAEYVGFSIAHFCLLLPLLWKVRRAVHFPIATTVLIVIHLCLAPVYAKYLAHMNALPLSRGEYRFYILGPFFAETCLMLYGVRTVALWLHRRHA